LVQRDAIFRFRVHGLGRFLQPSKHSAGFRSMTMSLIRPRSSCCGFRRTPRSGGTVNRVGTCVIHRTPHWCQRGGFGSRVVGRLAPHRRGRWRGTRLGIGWIPSAHTARKYLCFAFHSCCHQICCMGLGRAWRNEPASSQPAGVAKEAKARAGLEQYNTARQ